MSSDSSDAASRSDALVHVRPVDVTVSILLLLIGVALAIDNWRIGVNWAADGPQSGYFPFRLSLILIAASAWGLFLALWRRRTDAVFVEKDAFVRVLKVLVPTVAYVGAIYAVGIYVASAALISIFMLWIGKSKLLPSLSIAVGFSVAIFWLFEIKFKVLLPKGPLESWLGF